VKPRNLDCACASGYNGTDMAGDLNTLLSDGLIDEVLGRLKTGKEAEVWLVRHGDEVLAAKIYKERHVRSFKNNAGYKEGRQVRNTRTQRAIARGSKFGRESEEDAWKSAEADALYKLRAQGVRVPEPKAFYDGVLLMQLVVDGEGQPAPRLIDSHLTPEEAAAAYADLRAQVVTMLCAEIIHGDLSPYNVLLGAAGPTLIDFPQVVGAAHNSLAESFFRRDLENLRTHLAAIDPSLTARASDAAEIWAAYVRRDLTPDFVPTGRAPQAPDRHRAHDRPRQGRPQAPHGQGRPQLPHGHDRVPPPHGQGRAQAPHGQGRGHGAGQHASGRDQPRRQDQRLAPGQPPGQHRQAQARATYPGPGDQPRRSAQPPRQHQQHQAQQQPQRGPRHPQQQAQHGSRHPQQQPQHGPRRQQQGPRERAPHGQPSPQPQHARGGPRQAGRGPFPLRHGARSPARPEPPSPIVERVQHAVAPFASKHPEPQAGGGEELAQQPSPAEEKPPASRREE
jgi:RIO kinase 1